MLTLYRSNIGPAFDNVGSFVLKPNTALPVLRGGVGELCISGKLVGKGYLNRPDLTRERFPTLEGFNERVYRTGDLVRILHDDTFIFLGRADDQVKLRGQRLELGEINEVIKKSRSDLREVVTLVLRHGTQQKEQLVSFLVSTTPVNSLFNKGSLIATVRTVCKSRLPGYMVPTHFIPIKALPLNANNKVDSKQLTAMYNELSMDDLQKLSRSGEKDMPWTAAESEVLEAIARALRVDISALTRGTSIFELGMDSILIIGFSRSLQSAGYGNAKLSVIRSNTSISGLVQNLLNNKSANQEKEAAYISASQQITLFCQKHMANICRELDVDSMKVQKIAPCTPVQGGMIYRFLENGGPLYFNRFEFGIYSTVNAETLSKAWDSVIAQLEILRTKFVATGDGYAQVVLETAGAVRYEATSFSYKDTEKTKSLKSPWGYSLSSDRMVLQMFHGLYDGNSLTMILQRLVNEYFKLEKDFEVSEISYGPSFHASLPYGPLATMPGAKEFWTKHLETWSPQQIPSTPSQVGTVEVDDKLPNFEAFENLRKTLGVSHQAIIQAAWLSVQQAHISPSLTTTGIVTSGRTIDFEGADDVIGPLFNTIPFHMQIEPSTVWKTVITQCHQFSLQMQDFQHTPLKDIQKWGPSGIGQPLFETLFVFQHPDIGGIGFAKDLWTEKTVPATADYPLAFEATVSPKANGESDLALKLVADGSVTTTEQAANILKQIKSALITILHGQGQNTVFENLEVLPTTNGSTAQSQRQNMHEGDAISRDLEWTKDAELLRTEIASLANVAETDIHQDSSLFELGLDSIDVIKLSSRLRRHGINIAVSAIIRSQTIQKMAAAASRIGNQESTISSKGFVSKTSSQLANYLKGQGALPQGLSEDSVLPATPLQEGMFHLMTQSNYEMYFNVDIFKLDNKTNPDDLIKAVKKVVKASPVLSTYFLKIEDPQIPANYAQIVRGETFLDHSGSSFEDWDQKEVSQESLDVLRSAAISRATKSQDLFQVRYLAVGSDRFMVISIAHALYDGISIQLFHADIKRAYLGESIPRTDPRPYLEEVFKSTTEDAKKFWRSTLSNLPPARFPRNDTATSNPVQVHPATRQSSITFSQIQNFCKKSNIFVQTLGQTCWALVLAQLMGQLDVVFGTVLSCRDSTDAEQVMFPLMNTVAVRSVLHGTLDQMLKYMQEMSNTTRQYQHFPLGEAQSIALSSQAEAKDNNFFDTLFIYQGHRSPEEREPLYKSEFSHADVDFPICIELEISEEGCLSWTAACKSSVRDEEETNQILASLDTVLEHIINSPRTPTFVTDIDGISICGLPKFHKSDSDTKTTSERPARTLHDQWSDEELVIRKAFHHASGVPEESINKDTTIFELGLDSISVHKLRKLLETRGINLSVSEILKGLNIDAITQSLLRASKSNNSAGVDVAAVLSKAISLVDVASVIKNVDQDLGKVQFIMPVTAGQLYLLRGWQVSRGVLFYPTFYYRLSFGTFDKAMLEEAWKLLLENHNILRTGFIESKGSVLQVVFENPPNEVVYGRSCNHYRSPFGGSPPVTLVVNESMSKFGLTIHHALYDAVSIDILLDELQSLYQGQPSITQAPTGDLRSFMAQSICAGSQTTQPKALEKRQKWKSYLGNKDTLMPPSNQPSTVSGRTELFKPALEISGIKDYAKSIGITTDALFLAVMAEVFALKALPEHGVTFGIYLANRNPFDGHDFGSMAAPTLNLLPLRVLDPLRVSKNPKEVATNIQKDLRQIGSAEMSSTSLEEIYEWTGVRVNCFVNILKDMGDSECGGKRQDGLQYFVPESQPVDAEAQDGAQQLPPPPTGEHISEVYRVRSNTQVPLRHAGANNTL